MRLPVLEDVRVAAPCRADWASMQGDDRVRACGACKQNVYDLSAMTRDEALALINEREGRVCVRFYRRADGTILTKDCGVGVKRRRRRRVIVAGVLAMLGGSAVATQVIAAREEHPVCGGHTVGELAVPHGPPMMGAVSSTSAGSGSASGGDLVMGSAAEMPPTPKAP